MKNYFVLATSRSGHHAVAQWVCAHFPGKIHIVNDCRKGLEDGVLKGRPEEFGSEEYRFDNMGDDVGIVYTFERAMPEEVGKARELVNGDSPKYVVVVRDHYNWIASLMKIGVGITPDRLDCWKALMREVSTPRPSFSNFVDINFSKWFEDDGYRRDTLRRLGLAGDGCKHVNHVPKFGHGSSFDGMSKQEDAQKMRVLDRWAEFVDDERYLDIVREPELVELTKAYFEFNPLEVTDA